MRNCGLAVEAAGGGGVLSVTCVYTSVVPGHTQAGGCPAGSAALRQRRAARADGTVAASLKLCGRYRRKLFSRAGGYEGAARAPAQLATVATADGLWRKQRG